MRFLGRRAAYSVLLLLCVSVLSLALLKWTPGDYFNSVRVDPQISPEALMAMRAEHGLDKPLPVLYWKWLESVAKGDWGFSFAYNSAAGPILWPRARNTLLLASCATLLAWLIALPFGVAAAARRGSWPDFLTNGATALLLGIPEVVLALGLLLIATRAHNGLLGAPMSSADLPNPGVWEEVNVLVKRLLAPALCLSLGLLPLLISHISTGVAEVLQAPFVSAARSFGISNSRILFRWVMPAALNSMISLFGLSLGLLMSSSLVVEGVFTWPGLGQLMLQAISDRDIYLIVDSAIIAAAFLVIGNLAADVLLYFSDPRIRTE